MKVASKDAMCPQCRKPVSKPGQLCKGCYKNYRAWKKDRQARNLCFKCPNPPEKGKNYCSVCSEYKRKSVKRRLKKAGICTICSERPVKEHRLHCKECLVETRLFKLVPEDRHKARIAITNFDGACECCGGTNPQGKDWAVDHCHTTKKFRGLLCQGCNIMLGGAKDSPAILLAAVDYLHRSQSIKTVAA